MYLRDRVTPWVVVALVVFALGALLDIGVATSNDWGYTETNEIYTHVGLYEICNGTRIVTRRDRVELYRSDPKCFRSTKLDYDWVWWALVTQSLALVGSCVLLVAGVAFVVSLRWDWIRSRSALIALIPISISAAAFNLTGCVAVGVNLGAELRAGARYALGLDALSTALLATGALLSVLDIQACAMTRPPATVGKGLTRPI